MYTFKEITEARDLIVACWKEDGEKVVESAFNEHHKISKKEFLSQYTECDNTDGEKLFVGTLLTGMKKLYPKTYAAIPEDMGLPAFLLVEYTLLLCGVDIKN